MFHLATIAPGEVEVLRRIEHVIRLGRVQRLEADHMVLANGRVAGGARHAVHRLHRVGGASRGRCSRSSRATRIVLQLVRLPQPAFSAALIAYVEAHYDGDKAKNALCGTVPFPHTLDDYPRATLVNMWNQFQWGQDKALRQWIRDSRLDGFGKLMTERRPRGRRQAWRSWRA